MQVDAFRYFIELARAGSFNKAAQRSFISQQGLNKAISTLEDELGMKLVERTHAGIALTAAGKLFLEHAQVIFDDYKNMMDDLYELSLKEGKGTENARADLVIYASAYMTAMLAGMGRFREALGNAALREVSFKDIRGRLAKCSESDVFVTEIYNGTRASIAKDRSLDFYPLFETTIGVAWREGFPLAGHDQIELAELSDVALARNSHKEMARQVELLFIDHPLKNIQLRTSNIRLLVEFAHGRYATLIDSRAFEICQKDDALPTDGLHFTPLASPDARVQVGFLARHGMRQSPQARRACDLIRQFFE